MDPPGWAKYVQLRLRTHYGSEPVCALNDVRVYGKSAAEDLEDRLAMEAAADDEAAAQEECSADEGNAQESRLEPRQQSGPGDAEGIQQQSTEADADRDAEDVRPEQALSVPSDKLPKDELGQTEPKDGRKALGAEHNSEASAQSPESMELSDAIQMLPASGGPKPAIPPVLDLLGESLKRLIVPAGAGKKRSAYSGEPANPQALPEPDSGMPVPEGDRWALSTKAQIWALLQRFALVHMQHCYQFSSLPVCANQQRLLRVCSASLCVPAVMFYDLQA